MFEKVTEHIYVYPCDGYTDRPNIGLIIGSKYSLLYDTGNSAVHVDQMKDALVKQGLPMPDFVVDSHWHWDHTFGAAFWNVPVIAGRETNEQLKVVQQWKWDDQSMNYDRYADKLAWAYSELGLLYNLYDEDILASNYLRKGLDVLEASEHADFQQSQVEIISKMLVAVQLMIKQNNEGTNEVIYDLADRVFRFIYVYVKPSFSDSLEFNGTLYSLGEKLLYHFDSVDHEKTMQFYYPAVTELGGKKLSDSTVPEEEKMFINFTLASIAGLSGDTEKCESYLHAHLNSFQRTEDYLKIKFSKKRKGAKKKKR